jgi:hypothetical protein
MPRVREESQDRRLPANEVIWDVYTANIEFVLSPWAFTEVMQLQHPRAVDHLSPAQAMCTELSCSAL